MGFIFETHSLWPYARSCLLNFKNQLSLVSGHHGSMDPPHGPMDPPIIFPQSSHHGESFQWVGHARRVLDPTNKRAPPVACTLALHHLLPRCPALKKRNGSWKICFCQLTWQARNPSFSIMHIQMIDAKFRSVMLKNAGDNAYSKWSFSSACFKWNHERKHPWPLLFSEDFKTVNSQLLA